MILEMALKNGIWSYAGTAPAQIDFPQVFGDNLVLASLVVGFLLPILIATINRSYWTSEAKGLSAFVLCALAAVLLVYVQGLFDPADWLRSFLIIFVMAIFVWNQFYKPSQIGPNIEKLTG